SKAKEAAEREALKKAPGHQNEHRTFTRWRDPPLTVLIAGTPGTFTTADWSLGGMLIDQVPDKGWQPGQQLDVKIGIEGGKQYVEKTEVAATLRKNTRPAAKPRRFASVLMQVKRDCDAAGMEPSE